ncbi:MAG: citramalate synthase [Ignavibacteriales bacterium]|nr:citramalate synthase [Ignavibacteriales bacterium]
MKIHIYDTTLRDGTQREGISLSCEDKLSIAAKLDELGVDFIEGGWPGSNPKDVEFFQRAKALPLRHAVITAFGATCRVGGTPADDQNIKALLDSGAAVCTVVGKASIAHVQEVLRTTPEENCRIIEESIAFLVGQGRRVMFDAEHFFDGFVLDKECALSTLHAAERGGAEVSILCDTNGGTMPWEIGRIVREVQSSVHLPLGAHIHNDTDCAVASSLEAIRAGCIQVQGTINGYGERCGNANLISIIADISLKLGGESIPKENLRQLTELSHFVAEVANLSPDDHLPFVGRSAFAHKGGIHVAALRRSADSYQHISPEIVGNRSRIVVSELSGRGNLLSKAEEYGIDSSAAIGDILTEIKFLESQGFSFEAAEASVAIMMKRQQSGYVPPFELIDLTVNVEHRKGLGIFAEATVKVMVDGEVIHTASEGSGPVQALDAALRKALTPKYPALAQFRLSDYKVRILNGDQGTAAITRVLIDTHDGVHHWSTVGASANIIEASWRALADSVEYGLTL